MLRGIAGGDELGPLLLQFSDPCGQRLHFRLGGLGVLDCLVARGGESLALGLEFRGTGLGFFCSRGHFLHLLGAFGDLAGQLFLLRVGGRQGFFQFLRGGAQFFQLLFGRGRGFGGSAAGLLELAQLGREVNDHHLGLFQFHARGRKFCLALLHLRLKLLVAALFGRELIAQFLRIVTGRLA